MTEFNQLKVNLLSENSNRIRLNSQSSKVIGEDFGSKDPVNVEIDVTNVGPVQPIDGGWGWMIVVGSFMIMFLLDGICLSYGLFLNALESSFGNVPKLQMMFAGSSITGCYLIMGPAASALSNQYGFRVLIIMGSIISSVSLFVSSFMYNITAFVLIYGLGGGIGYSLIYLPGCTIIALWFEKYRATATGIAICGSGCGAAAFSVLIPYLIELYTWRGCLMILAALNCNCLIAAVLFRPMKSPVPMITLTQPTDNAISDPNLEKMISDMAMKTVENNIGAEGKNNIPIEKINSHLIDLVMKNKERDRAKSTGSLNNMIITSDNKLVEPSQYVSTQQMINLHMIRKIVFNYLNKQEAKKIPNYRSQFNLFGHKESKRNSLIYSQNSMVGSCLIASQPQLISSNNIFRSVLSLRPVADQNIPVTREMARKISEIVSEEFSRPLLKPDLYYPGSVQHLNNENIHFASSQYAIQSQNLYSSVKTLSPAREALNRLMDISILKSGTVQMNLASNFIGMFGFLIPFQFLVSYATIYQIEEKRSATLLTILGIGSCFGRILTGFVADRRWANCLIIHNVCLIIAGIDTMLLPFMTNYTTMMIFVVIYAFSTAAVISLKTIVIVDVMGTEKLTNIFGWTILAQGIAILFGPPCLGSFYDYLQNYTYTFILGGALLSLSGILSAPLRIISRLEKKHKGQYDTNGPSIQLHLSSDSKNFEMTVK